MQTNPTLSPRVPTPKLAFGLLVSLAALLAVVPDLGAQSGTWTNNVNGTASGSWAGASNWNNLIIASGADNTADFSTLDLTNLSTVTLDGARTIGNVIFGDTTASPSTNWALATGGGGPLTLAVSAGSPTITANNGSNLITAVLAGVSGVTKSGIGTLRLNTANPNLQNLVIIDSGILQIGQAGAVGTNGNHTANDRVINTNGGTIEIMNTIQPNNKHLTLLGAGVGGTQGALFANSTSGSTRWGLSSLNAAGTSANSSAGFPAISLLGDTTIRIDGDAIGLPTVSFAIGHVSGTNSTLTKTGGGRLSFDRGVSGITNLIIQGGGYQPNQGGAFGSIQYYTVASGAAIVNNQNNCFSATASIVMSAGSLFDVYNRADVQTYTQNIGYLNGSGLLTCGMRTGAGGTTTLVIQGSDSNSVFNGAVTVSNAVVFNITKNSTATLSLGGTNTYNGTSLVNAGTWFVNGRHIGGNTYTVAAGAALGGSGTIVSAPIVLNGAGAVLVAGDNGGTLTVSNVTGAGDVIVSNANLTVNGQLNNSGSGFLNSLSLTNSTTTAKLQQGGTEASIHTTTLNVDGTNNTLSYTTDNPATGQFPFIKYGVIGGLDGFAGLQIQNPSGIGAYLSNNVANSSIDIVVTNIPALVWRGTPTGDWSIGGSANWLNGVTPSAYTETAGLGPFVIFDDTAAGTPTVNLTTAVTPKGITVSSSAKNYTYTGSGSIGGTGSWVKDGSSTNTIANTASNTFSGTITINAGALSVGNGGAAGNLGAASVVNNAALIFNRSDNVSIGNAISGTGTLVKEAANTTTLTGVGNIGGNVTVNAGTLALAPAGTITVSGDVTGSGGFGVVGAGTVVLSSGTISYTGGTVITNGTLQLDAAFPPSGDIVDHGTLAIGVGGTLANNISGTGGVSLFNFAAVTLTGANTYSGPTVVLGGSLDATTSTYSPNSTLTLGSLSGGAHVGTANFTAGNPVLPGLRAGGNDVISQDTINLTAGGQTLTINGDLTVGNPAPVAAVARLQVTGTGASVIVNTNGGVIQLGLGATGSGVNPDYVIADFSQIDNFVANLGATGTVNLGTLDGNPGPPAGATVLNQLRLAAVSNSITAGLIHIGAGGRQLIPELRLGAGTNVLHADTVTLGAGRDGGSLLFDGATGGVRLRAADGVSRVALNVGNWVTGTGAGITNKVDVTGHSADLLVSSLILGNLNNAGAYECSLSFDQGVLDASSTSLSVTRNNNANAPLSFSTLTINGGTASLGPVNLTASVAPGNLLVANASLTVSNITSPGAGLATFDINASTLNLALGTAGGLATPAVDVDTFNASGAVPINITGGGFVVGQHVLIKYTGGIGGSGFSALSLGGLPAGVSATLSNNTANASVDLLVTAAPPLVNTNPTNLIFSVTGSTLNLSWPGDYLGWTIESNAVSVVSSNDWHRITNSSGVTNLSLNLDAGKTNVFFRMVLP